MKHSHSLLIYHIKNERECLISRFKENNTELTNRRRSIDDAVGIRHKVTLPSCEKLNLQFSDATATFGGARAHISRLFLVLQAVMSSSA